MSSDFSYRLSLPPTSAGESLPEPRPSGEGGRSEEREKKKKGKKRLKGLLIEPPSTMVRFKRVPALRGERRGKRKGEGKLLTFPSL